MSEQQMARKEDGLNQAPTPKQRADTLRGISPQVVARARGEGQNIAQAGVRDKGHVPTSELQRPSPVAGSPNSAPASREHFRELDGVGHPNAGSGNAGAKQNAPAVEQTTETTAQKTAKPAKSGEKAVEAKGPVTNGAQPTPAQLAARFRGEAKQAQITPAQTKGEQKAGPPRATPQPPSRGGRGGPGD